MKKHVPGARMVGRLASWYVQWKAQRVAVLSRKTVMKMDSWLDEAISFSGQNLI